MIYELSSTRGIREVFSQAQALNFGVRVGRPHLFLPRCTLPGEKPAERLGETEMEVGLGIHGEPGYEKAAVRYAAPLGEVQCATAEIILLRGGVSHGSITYSA